MGLRGLRALCVCGEGGGVPLGPLGHMLHNFNSVSEAFIRYRGRTGGRVSGCVREVGGWVVVLGGAALVVLEYTCTQLCQRPMQCLSPESPHCLQSISVPYLRTSK